MGIREVMDEHPQATKGVLGAVIVLCVAFIAFQIFAGRRAITTKLPDAYFTDDDGKTFFAASPDNIPPFNHQGKTAVFAHVYRCEGKDFVAYMSRFVPEAKARIMAAKRVTAEDERFGRELKKPGSSEWIKASDLKRVTALADVKGPNGQTDVEPVEPGA